MDEKALDDRRNSNRVSDRLTVNPQDNTYIHWLSLPQTRIWIRCKAHNRIKQKGVGDCKDPSSQLHPTICTENGKGNFNETAKKYIEALIVDTEKNFIKIVTDMPPLYSNILVT